MREGNEGIIVALVMAAVAFVLLAVLKFIVG